MPERPGIVLADIEPELLDAFVDSPGHGTLGEHMASSVDMTMHTPGEQDITPETALMALPIGSKFFITDRDPVLARDGVNDAVAIIVGHTHVGRVVAKTLRPKGGGPWPNHNAYGVSTNESFDAVAALDRIFGPQSKAGSVAVLSRVTTFGDALPVATVGTAGCDSHETAKVDDTLAISQLLDKYDVGEVEINPRSARIRRAADGYPHSIKPGVRIQGQPSVADRDKRGMFDRIEGLISPDGAMRGSGAHDVLRGINAAVNSGDFANRERPITDVQDTITKAAGTMVL